MGGIDNCCICNNKNYGDTELSSHGRTLQFYRIPLSDLAIPERLENWESFIKILKPNFRINKSTRICSNHFIDGEPTKKHPFPTIYGDKSCTSSTKSDTSIHQTNLIQISQDTNCTDAEMNIKKEMPVLCPSCGDITHHDVETIKKQSDALIPVQRDLLKAMLLYICIHDVENCEKEDLENLFSTVEQKLESWLYNEQIEYTSSLKHLKSLQKSLEQKNSNLDQYFECAFSKKCGSKKRKLSLEGLSDEYQPSEKKFDFYDVVKSEINDDGYDGSYSNPPDDLLEALEDFWECKHCSDHLDTAAQLIDHIQQAHAGISIKWVAAVCGNYSVHPVLDGNVLSHVTYRQCSECEYITSSYPCFVEHMMNDHSTSVSFHCNKCSHSEDDYENYVKHVVLCKQNKDSAQSIMENLDDYMTKEEKGMATSDEGLNEWVQAGCGKYNFFKKTGSSVDTSRIFRLCPHCHFFTIHYSQFGKHMLVKHKEAIEYECADCGVSFPTVDAHNSHKKNRQCCAKRRSTKLRELSLKSEPSGSELERQPCQYRNDVVFIKYDDGKIVPTYSCQTCKFETQSILWYSMHLSNEHENTGEDVFQCHVCDCKAGTYMDFKKHQSVHSKQESLMCDLCSFVASKWPVLEEHTRRHTGEKPYLCDICGKGFKTVRDHQIHELKHKENAKFPCPHPDCSYLTSYRHALKAHMRRHKSKTQCDYQCTACEYETNNKVCYKRHIKIHLGMMEFKCPECEFMAYNQRAVRIHLVKHTQTPEFSCSICNVGFTTLPNYRTHMMSHEGVKPFQCSICGFQSAFKSKLKTHIVRIHPKQKGFCIDNGEKLKNDVTKTNLTHEDKVLRVIYDFKEYNENGRIELYIKELRQANDKEVLTVQCDKCSYASYSSNAFILHKLMDHGGNLQLPPITEQSPQSGDPESDYETKRRHRIKKVPTSEMISTPHVITDNYADVGIEEVLDDNNVVQYVLVSTSAKNDVPAV